MSHDEAVQEYARLILKYGLQWRVDVPAKAYERMVEVCKVLTIDERLQIVRRSINA